MMIKWQDAEIVEKNIWCDDLFSIKIKSESVTFKAGQFLNIGIQQQEGITYRPYSLVSTAEDDLLEIHFNRVENGEFSPLLAALEPGDKLLVPAKGGGLLTIDQVPDCRYLWLCATATGIGPFLSILRSKDAWQRFEKIIVCYASKTVTSMAYRQELISLSQQRPEQFQFIACATRDTEQQQDIYQERFTSLLDSGELERTVVDIDQQSHFMLCGNSMMIDDMIKRLEARGLARNSRLQPGQISIEKYF